MDNIWFIGNTNFPSSIIENILKDGPNGFTYLCQDIPILNQIIPEQHLMEKKMKYVLLINKKVFFSIAIRQQILNLMSKINSTQHNAWIYTYIMFLAEHGNSNIAIENSGLNQIVQLAEFKTIDITGDEKKDEFLNQLRTLLTSPASQHFLRPYNSFRRHFIKAILRLFGGLSLAFVLFSVAKICYCYKNLFTAHYFNLNNFIIAGSNLMGFAGSSLMGFLNFPLVLSPFIDRLYFIDYISLC